MMQKFKSECCCGGNELKPNNDCERCQMVAEIERLRQSVDFTHQWYAVRWKRLRELISEQAEGIETEACAVMANGTTDSCDPPTYDQILNRLNHTIKLLLNQVAEPS